MQVEQCMTRDVRVIAPDDTIERAAQIMGQIDAGVLPVSNGDRLVGIITDRDIAVRGVGEGCAPTARVGDIMSSEVKYCYAEEDTDEVLDNMAQIQVRRLPVVDQDKRLVGIVSIGDLAKEEQSASGEALSDIARPSALHSQ